MASEEVFATRHAAAADQLDQGQLDLAMAGYQDLVTTPPEFSGRSTRSPSRPGWV